MRVIVVGAGEVGYQVAQRLSAEQHDVVVVDVNPERLDYIQSRLDVAVVEGSGSSPAVLERAGIKEAELLAAVTNLDEVNLVCCMTARARRNLTRIARISNPDFYTDGGRLQPELFGVDVMINPERELALETFRLLQSTAATDIAVFAGGAVQLVGLVVTEKAPIAGRKLAEIGAAGQGRPILTVAIERGGKTVVPTGNSEIRAGDHVYVVAATAAIPRVLELCGYEHSEVHRVMIAGGSHEAFYLAQLLRQHNVQAILIVKDRERAQDLAEKLDRALVLNADATDVELLELEGVGGMDAFVALTERDEINILSALLAKQAGAKQVITLLNRVEYVPLARRIGLDTAVSPRLSAAAAILRYVRRGAVTRVATLKDIDAEAIGFVVDPGSPVAGRPLAEIRFPEGCLVAAIVRGEQVIIPRGADVLRAGDTAIVFALPEAVGSVVKLFNG
ncbi:MAG: Trk system potassium transport protein TrkA [Gemmatimonadales bacterium]|nr:MAG: Trk system potassium transport protein TrkA [Gemmatimonadales bacterium]